MTNGKRMEELIAAFCEMFPEWFPSVKEYKPFQRDVIIVILEDGRSYVFMYKGPEDWSFGTKLYRAKPRKIEKKQKEVS